MFYVGQKVRSLVDAQGMLKGQVYIVGAIHSMRNFTGRYYSYTLHPVDRTIAAPQRPIGNAHLVLEEV